MKKEENIDDLLAQLKETNEQQAKIREKGQNNAEAEAAFHAKTLELL